MDVRIMNHSQVDQNPGGLCVLPPGQTLISPEMFVRIEGDARFSDKTLEVLAMDGAKVEKARETARKAAEAKAEAAKPLDTSKLEATAKRLSSKKAKPSE